MMDITHALGLAIAIISDPEGWQITHIGEIPGDWGDFQVEVRLKDWSSNEAFGWINLQFREYGEWSDLKKRADRVRRQGRGLPSLGE